MSTVAKILVVLNLGLAAVFLGSASNYLGQQDNYLAKLTQEQTDHAQSKSNYKNLLEEAETRTRNLAADKVQADKARDVAIAEAAARKTELDQLRNAYNEASSNLTVATRAVDQLSNSLNAQRTLSENLQTNNNQLRANLLASQQDRDAKVAMVNSLQLQLENETKARTALVASGEEKDEQIKRLAFKNQYFIEKYPGETASSQPSHNGRVLAVDNQANVFVVSLGKEDGVEVGFQYTVSRGSEYIATIQIDNVQAKKAAGYAVKGLSKGPINRNDKVQSGR